MDIDGLMRTICDAIEDRRLVDFSYKWRHRVVEPHLVGVHEEEEELMLRGFQVDGESESGGLPDWRLFRLRKMSRFEVLEAEFDPRMEEFEPRDPDLTTRECWVGQV